MEHRKLRSVSARFGLGPALLVACAPLALACSKDERQEPAGPVLGGDLDAGTTPEPDAAPPPPPPPVLPTRVCTDAGWCWDGAGVHNDTLNAVAGSAAGDLWAVGELGLALHFDGERWLPHWAPARETLRAVSVRGTDVWAAGDAATLLHLVNETWQAEAIPGLPEDARLRGVWSTDGGDLGVVGAGGVLFERIAGTWASVDVAAGAALNAVWASGAEVWAVGDGGIVLRRDAEGWARVDAGTAQNLVSVHGRAGQVWVAGASGEVRRYDSEAATWDRPTSEGVSPSGELQALRVDAEHVFVANELGQVFVWDETPTCPVPGDAGAPEQPCPEWLPARVTPGEMSVLGLWSSGEHVVAVGLYGSITSWDAETRTAVSEGSRDNYLDVSGATDGDVWVAGDRLLRRREGRWQPVDKDSPRAVYAVEPFGDRTMIAGTGGLARGYTSDGWQDMDVRPDAWLRALFLDAGSGWLVGSRGASWGLLNGRLWTPLATPTERDLLGVFGVPSGSVWAVGAAGVILRHDGLQWAAIPSGPNGGVTADLRGVWGSAEDDVWAVGTGATALHWDGSVWKPASVGDGVTFSLNTIWGRSKSDVWAAGSGGTLLHYDGQRWQPEFSGTSQALNSIWGGATRLWAVGEHGTLLVKELE